jgi:hypothetical protein
MRCWFWFWRCKGERKPRQKRLSKMQGRSRYGEEKNKKERKEEASSRDCKRLIESEARQLSWCSKKKVGELQKKE